MVIFQGGLAGTRMSHSLFYWRQRWQLEL